MRGRGLLLISNSPALIPSYILVPFLPYQTPGRTLGGTGFAVVARTPARRSRGAEGAAGENKACRGFVLPSYRVGWGGCAIEGLLVRPREDRMNKMSRVMMGAVALLVFVPALAQGCRLFGARRRHGFARGPRQFAPASLPSDLARKVQAIMDVRAPGMGVVSPTAPASSSAGPSRAVRSSGALTDPTGSLSR